MNLFNVLSNVAVLFRSFTAESTSINSSIMALCEVVLQIIIYNIKSFISKISAIIQGESEPN